MPPRTAEPVVVRSYLGPGDERSLADDVLDGLTRPFKELPPKHFYDAEGARLFESITEQPEYYQTRTERSILSDHASELVAGAEVGAHDDARRGQHASRTPAKICRRSGRSQLRNVFVATRGCVAHDPPRSTR